MKLSTLLTASFISLFALPAAASASTGVAKQGDKDDSSASLAAAFKNLPSSLSALESFSFKTKTNDRRLSFSQCLNETGGFYMETDLDAYDPFEFVSRYFYNENPNGQTCTSNDADYPKYEYTCDTGNYFDHEAIQEICDDQEGNKITFELLIKHDNGTTGIIPDVPACIANSCDPWDIFLILNQGFLSAFDGAGVTVEARAPGNEGMECLYDTLASYGFEWSAEVLFGDFVNATNPNALSPYVPIAILQSDPEAFCDTTTSAGEVAFHCDASRGVPNAEIESICVETGGKYIEIDHTGGQDYHAEGAAVEVSIKNVPWCLASTCKVEDGIAFADFLSEWSLEMDLESMESKIDGCDEKGKDTFFLKIKGGEAVTAKCRNLSKLSVRKQKLACAKRWSPEGLGLARHVCPATCGRCDEHPANTFLKSWNREIQAPVVKSCEWLSEQSDKKKDKFCGRKYYRQNENRVVGDDIPVPSAYSACPHTCAMKVLD